MSLTSIVLMIVALGIFVYTFASFISNLKLRNKMKRREHELREAGISLYESSLPHGICIEKSTGIVYSDKKSL